MKQVNKKGVSAIVTVVILVLLVIVAIGLVWVTVSNIVEEGLDDASCVSIFNKVSLGEFTCYDSASLTLLVATEIGDIELDRFLITVSSEGTSKGYNIYEGFTYAPLETIEVMNHNGAVNLPLYFPGPNEGLTYQILGFSTTPDSVKISPIIDGNSCGATDTISDIPDC